MSSPRPLNVALLLAFAVLLGLNWAVRRDITVPNTEFIPEMVRTPRYNAYSPNGNFPDGKTLQAPEPGTIPRGYLPLHYRATREGALRAGEELSNPFSAGDARALERGAFVFANFCQECHGPTGRGDGAVVMRGFPAPPALMAERGVQMKDGQMFHILSYGQGNMPSYASQLSREDRWRVILHVRSLQKPAAPRLTGGQP